MQIVALDNLHEMTKLIVSEKRKRTKIVNLSSAELAQGVVKVKF